MAQKKKGKRSFADILEESSSASAGSVDDLIRFSFKYLSFDNPKFRCGGAEASYFFELLERLKALSSMRMSDFLANRSAGLRSHPIRWEDVTEAGFGIPNEEQLAVSAYQCAVSANESGRVHGFIIDTRFYVVWLDRDHKLYA